MLIMGVGDVNAKLKTTTLWEGTYTDYIAIPAAKLMAGGTVTVYMTVTDGTQLRIVYKKNSAKQDEEAFKGNGGTIEDWKWQNEGTDNYQFSIEEADMSILNDNTEGTGSTGYLYIGSSNTEKLTISKITITTNAVPTSSTSVWSGSHDLANWNGLQLTGSTYHDILKNAKMGDVLRVTYTSDEAGQINVCYSDYSGIDGGHIDVAVIAEPTTIEFEIVTATILEKIQSKGIVLNGQNALLSAVDLLTYDDSYDAVAVTIGSDGIATFSSKKDLDFSGTGITVYYASAVEEGLVRLTSKTTTWNYQGYILVGDEGTYEVPVTASASYPSGNFLEDQISEGTVAASIEGTYHYIFAKNSSGDIGFYKLTTAHTLGAKKAYLETTTDITPTAGTKAVSLVFSDETTGISSVQAAVCEDQVYTLSGVRVAKPTRGLYIVGGRKVFVK